MPVGQVHKRKFSRNLAIIAAIFAFCALVWTITMVKMANAAEVVQCGTPAPANLETEVPQDYCDIYSRQLNYREDTLEFHDQIEERRRNFAGPMNEARHNYEMSRDALRGESTPYNP
ncbi:MAG: hypothetical protein ACT4OY_02175 [Alphaproteobacteria bacterium]